MFTAADTGLVYSYCTYYKLIQLLRETPEEYIINLIRPRKILWTEYPNEALQGPHQTGNIHLWGDHQAALELYQVLTRPFHFATLLSLTNFKPIA